MLEAASLFTDGAVLCRDREIRVFGRADHGMRVEARLEDARGGVLAEGEACARDGRFLVCLPPQRAQTGCRLILRGGGDRISAEDIAVGDVYLAGGQSNMELELRNSLGGADQAEEDPLLRFFNVPRKAYVCPEQEAAIRQTRWQPVTRDSAGYNSAVAMHFGAAMRKAHPEIPVGIIGCYWGGTSVACWMDEETLRSMSEGIRYLDEYAGQCGSKTMETYLAEEEAFNCTIEAWNRTVEEYRQDHPDAAWEEIQAACGLCPWNPPVGPGSPYRPAGLAESMLKEMTPYPLTAVLYYQGEEDTWRTDHYDLLMTALIRFWRREFRSPELPFLFVQLPMWLDIGAEDTFRWAKTRLAQAAVRDSVRNTGMICLLDEGEYGNIHPVNKKPVGERLAMLAEGMLYGRGEESPRAAERWIRGDVIVIRMTRPITTRDSQPPRLLEVAGEDGHFVPAEGTVADDILEVRAAGIPHPVSARYAWTDWSDRVNLFGVNGLPVEPFLL